MPKRVSVAQQPAGFVDGIIVAWIVEDLSHRHPQAIHLRDAYAAGLSGTYAKLSYQSRQLQVTLAGKVTPVRQVSDTDVAFPLTAACDIT